MVDYKEMYAVLFQSMSKAISVLQEAQREVEETCISNNEENPDLLPDNGDETNPFIYPKRRIKQ